MRLFRLIKPEWVDNKIAELNLTYLAGREVNIIITSPNNFIEEEVRIESSEMFLQERIQYDVESQIEEMLKRMEKRIKFLTEAFDVEITDNMDSA